MTDNITELVNIAKESKMITIYTTGDILYIDYYKQYIHNTTIEKLLTHDRYIDMIDKGKSLSFSFLLAILTKNIELTEILSVCHKYEYVKLSENSIQLEMIIA